MKKNFSKLYQELTPQEFASLSYNLSMKNELEALDELHATQGRSWEHTGDTYRRAVFYNMIAANHQIDQLTCFITCTLIKLRLVQTVTDDQELSDEQSSQVKLLTMISHLFKTRQTGWESFVESLGVDPDLANHGFGAALYLEMARELLEDFELPEDDVKHVFRAHREIEGEFELCSAEGWEARYTKQFEECVQ